LPVEEESKRADHKPPPAHPPSKKINISKAPTPVLTPATIQPSPNKKSKELEVDSPVDDLEPDPKVAPEEHHEATPEARGFLDRLKLNLEDMQERIRNDVQNLHIELIRQFTIQQSEMANLLNS
jgi:hypothetical protein